MANNRDAGIAVCGVLVGVMLTAGTLLSSSTSALSGAVSGVGVSYRSDTSMDREHTRRGLAGVKDALRKASQKEQKQQSSEPAKNTDALTLECTHMNETLMALQTKVLSLVPANSKNTGLRQDIVKTFGDAMMSCEKAE